MVPGTGLEPCWKLVETDIGRVGGTEFVQNFNVAKEPRVWENRLKIDFLYQLTLLYAIELKAYNALVYKFLDHHSLLVSSIQESCDEHGNNSCSSSHN